MKYQLDNDEIKQIVIQTEQAISNILSKELDWLGEECGLAIYTEVISSVLALSCSRLIAYMDVHLGCKADVTRKRIFDTIDANIKISIKKTIEAYSKHKELTINGKNRRS